MQRKAKNAMAENSFLVNECNMLRRENHRLRQKVGQMETTLQLSAKPLMRSQSATTTAASSFDPRNQPGWGQGRSGTAFASDEKKQPEVDTSGGMFIGGDRNVSTAAVRGHTRASMPSRQALTASPGKRAGRRHGRQVGRLIKGSTRPMTQAAGARSKVQELLGQLDDNNRELEMQRIEIRRLREQVQMLVGQMGESGRLDGIGGSGIKEEMSASGLGALKSMNSGAASLDVPALVMRAESAPLISK